VFYLYNNAFCCTISILDDVEHKTMIKPEYSKEIDALRIAYNTLYWLRWFFPGNIAAELNKELPAIVGEQGQSTPYTSAQARDIIRAFNNANGLLKLLFTCLRAFQASIILRDYNGSNDDLLFTDRISELPDAVLSRHAPPGMPLSTETPAARAITDGSNALPASIGEFLGTRDLARLGAASRRFHGVFKPELKKAKLQKLLEYVVRGEQYKAEALLRTEPGLLIERSDVTDYSDRTFHNVSPWECMLWALDTRYMGQMMLACIPEGGVGDAIRRELVAQYDAMQGGGSDLVRIGGDVSPIDMSFDELGKCFDNEDALLFWHDQLYYAKKGSPPAVLIEPTITDAHRDDFNRLVASLERTPPNKARKSTPEEHALIAATTHHTLGLKGIHYEQPATYKSLVKIGGNINPGYIGFADIARLFDTNDALLFWNNQLYYANKADSTVTPIIPTFSQPATQIAAFDALGASLTSMPDNTARPPRTLEEYQLINTLFAEHSAFKPTHHCDSHYDFGVIDALQTYVDRFNGLDWPQRDALWLKTAKKQREMPAHVLQHYCDQDREFYPTPDFKAARFRRRGRIDTYISISERFDPSFGFLFGVCRGDQGVPDKSGHAVLVGADASYDLLALHELSKVRADDAKQLQDNLHHSLELVAAGPLVTRGPG
jgi:hypothetical protein